MHSDYMRLPDGGKLIDGDIVILYKYPNTKWVVHCGWYTYKSHQYDGWYIVSIPDQTILPLNEEDTFGLVKLSQANCPPPSPHCPPPHHHHHDPHHPPHPGHHPGLPFTHRDNAELEAAMIVVDTLAERNQLNDMRRIIHGKVVKVNTCPNGEPGYFTWNATQCCWDEENFGAMTEEEIKQVVLETVKPLDDRLNDVEDKVAILDDGAQWKKIKEE